MSSFNRIDEHNWHMRSTLGIDMGYRPSHEVYSFTTNTGQFFRTTDRLEFEKIPHYEKEGIPYYIDSNSRIQRINAIPISASTSSVPIPTYNSYKQQRNRALTLIK